ncbi:unnamed protein product [Notodromas monacha]|uniref:Uncharacterized protein n=1 Tax=Notodromas monacha TaxID=399045 RepID=A0A7R9BYR6_9CRUS|nr:unnamed protein product [Notodromas monacha]CAG0924169.1 unnamed protein product [Notodromas monacha]
MCLSFSSNKLKSMFSDKIAVVTGATSGIGFSTSLRLSSLGAQLVLVGRDEAKLEEIWSRCHEINKRENLKIRADFHVQDEAEKVIRETINQFGRIDVLINNAGIQKFGGIEETSTEEFDEVMIVDLRSVLCIIKEAVPHLIESKGVIVNVSSINGIRSFPGKLSYNVAKAGLDQLTRSVSLGESCEFLVLPFIVTCNRIRNNEDTFSFSYTDLAKYGIRCNSVNPGVIVTELQKRAGLTDDEYEQYLERSKETHPLGRAGRADEVASAIVFLASDQASFITGVCLPVDGGRHATCAH